MAKDLEESKAGRAAAVDEARDLKRKLFKCGTAIALERERKKIQKLQAQKKNEHEKWRYQMKQADSALSRLVTEGDSAAFEAQIVRLTEELAKKKGEINDLRISLEEMEEENSAL